MFNFFKKRPEPASTTLWLYNTLTDKKEEFTSIRPNKVGMYHCGPTVYNRAHIGNLRQYILADLLRRTFEYYGYGVRQIINVTDVGHLVSDADEGEDKIEKAARAQNKSAKEIATKFTKLFLDDIAQLNVKTKGTIFPKATEHIDEQIALIQELEEKGYTYKTSDGIYFNTTEFKDYGKLGEIDIENLKEGARVEINEEKKSPTDFALWKFSPEGEKRQQEWNSPWGVGFPGWHIECSAMAMSYLGATLDVHTGGVDHISIHHNNEIAQSEAATGQPFARYWMHGAFLTIAGEKISKSLGNVVYLDDITKRGFSAISFRYWLLTAHYSSLVNFNWNAIESAQNTLTSLVRHLNSFGTSRGIINQNYFDSFLKFIANDLDTPKAIALMWELVKDKSIPVADKRETIFEFDKILGLNLEKLLQDLKEAAENVPSEIRRLAQEREDARSQKDWKRADELRELIKSRGYALEDTDKGPLVHKI